MIVPAKTAPGAVIGSQVGNAANSINEYNQLRTTQALKIKELENALRKNRGGCPQRAELEAALAYWRNVDKQVRHAEGAALQAMGVYWNT